MAKFKGSKCLTGDCGGHRAGYGYAKSGGTVPSAFSPSFNKGMALATNPKPAPKAKKISKTSIAAGLAFAGVVLAINKGNDPQ